MTENCNRFHLVEEGDGCWAIANDAGIALDDLYAWNPADVFSSRPHLIVMGDAINCTTTNQTTLPYGDRWRMHRKL
jgi:hypothetical protein